MTEYKRAIMTSMDYLTINPKIRFIGYNTACGSRLYNTLDGVPKDMCIETPVCENLMMGLAMGMSLVGYKPVVCFERHDFLLVGMDAIVNHLDKLPILSGGQFTFPVIIRAIVGGREPLDPGLQHIQDYTEIIREYTSIAVRDTFNPKQVRDAYNEALQSKEPMMVIEYKDLY